ncbi:MAG: T9SS type A sorting domain-containing protein [Saprospiraceae bacterium]|nr:T9SS type A sorting domain-containing protein [Saprospiraceae bacterium]
MRYVTYKLNDEGQITDSIAHSPDGIDRWGWIAAQEERIFFHGIRWVGSAFTNIRHTVIEYDQQLEQVGETIGASITPSTGVFFEQITNGIIKTQVADFHLYNDTLLAAYQFLMIDSPLVFQGKKHFFFKTGLDGTVYVKKELPVGEMENVFFANGKMYVQGNTFVAGSNWNARELSEFDSDGNLIRGINYDSYGSEWLEGSLGGWHKGRFYLTYFRKADNLPGCSAGNIVIDVRDSSWAVLHRFKLPDCEYKDVSGKMPFAFDAQDNVYYAAPHESFRKIMVYKFTPDFQLLWKSELDFSDQQIGIYPVSQILTADGGILLNCNERSGGVRSLRIFKISATGDVVSSTSLPLSKASTGPLVYPNPTVGPLRVLPDFSAAAVAQVTSIDGRLMGVFDLSAQQIDLSAYPSGMYAISLWAEGRRALLGTEVVVKQ